jgi:hypothetical protein
MKIETANIKETLSYKLVLEEARYLSMKMQNTIFVIQRGSTLFTSLSREKGNILSVWNLGNQIYND